MFSQQVSSKFSTINSKINSGTGAAPEVDNPLEWLQDGSVKPTQILWYEVVHCIKMKWKTVHVFQ